jgi:hypothetical protein
MREFCRVLSTPLLAQGCNKVILLVACHVSLRFKDYILKDIYTTVDTMQILLVLVKDMTFALLLAFKSTSLEPKSWYLAPTKDIKPRHIILDKNHIEITYNSKYVEIYFNSHAYFEPLSKRQRMVDALIQTLRKETIFGVTCWEVKSHLSRLWCF